jgi:hypothetical protein
MGVLVHTPWSTDASLNIHQCRPPVPPSPRYMNLIPRNAFVLDLELFVEAFAWHHSVCNSRRRDVPVRWGDRVAAWARGLECRCVVACLPACIHACMRAGRIVSCRMCDYVSVCFGLGVARLILTPTARTHARTHARLTPHTAPSSALASGATDAT